jgi:aldehyde dehydrogenase (NAD+)
MTIASPAAASLRHADRFFIGGEWVQPSSDSKIQVTDSTTEEIFLTVAEAQADDVSRAVGAARAAFDQGPWASLSHAERAGYLRAIAAGLRERAADLSQVWPRESGVLYAISSTVASEAAAASSTTPGWPTPSRSRNGPPRRSASSA